MNLDISLRNLSSNENSFDTIYPVQSVCWSTDGCLLSCSDDKKILKWNSNSNIQEELCSIDTYMTSLSLNSRSLNKPGESFVIGCSDGSFRFLSATGREEKKIQGHMGSVIQTIWSHDNLSILTTGEDGHVKLWSRNGNIRATLFSSSQPIYQACWSPNDKQILIASSKYLIIKSVESSQKSIQWEAHSELIVAIDWNVVDNCIVSGGEDCKYCIWDCFGKLLYRSRAFDNVITSVAFSPNGDYLAVGSYNLIVLADQKGSPNCSYTIFSGSLYKISWTHDSTKIAAAGALGCIIFADVNGRHIENNNYDITILDDGKVKVYNVSKDFSEDIYISKDRVIDVCVNEEWLLIITSSQCYIYNLSNLNTPYIINLRVNPLTAQISKSNFMILDQVEGIQIFSFEGKNISNPKHPNVRFESLNCNTTSVTSNIVFVIDSMEFKTVFAFDVITGKEISKFSHTSDISKISAFEQISELYEPNQCIIVFLDINKDLYLVQLKLKPLRNQISSKSIKLQGNIDSFKLDIYYNTLVGLTLEGQILVWYHPSVVFIDKELLSISRTIIDASQYGRGLRLINYTGTRIQIRKQDGCIEYIVVPQYFPLLFEYCRESMWNESVMLCRNQKNSILWGTLASYSLLKKQYAIAEIAFCEVNDVAKAEYVRSLKEESRGARIAK